jgi:hypothetical protein
MKARQSEIDRYVATRLRQMNRPGNTRSNHYWVSVEFDRQTMHGRVLCLVHRYANPDAPREYRQI